MARDIDPHCGWKPHWDDSGVSTNAIDGTKKELLSLESTTADGAASGSLHYATLTICFENGKLCERGRAVGVYVAVHGMLEPVSYEPDEDTRTSVRLKFDDEKPLGQTWDITEDHDALYPARNEKQFVDQLLHQQRLVLEFSYYEKAPRTVTFDLSGLADEMKSVNLVAEEITKVSAAPAHSHAGDSEPGLRGFADWLDSMQSEVPPECKNRPGSESLKACEDRLHIKP